MIDLQYLLDLFDYKRYFSCLIANNKQLLDDVEYDIMNYQNRGLCYLPKPKAEADNKDTRSLKILVHTARIFEDVAQGK